MAQEEAAPTVTEKERKFPCKACGANLVFAPKDGALKCGFCGHEEKIPQTADEIKEYSFNDYLAKPKSTGYGETPGQRRDVRCSGCGAIAHLDANIRATTCGYCGAPLVVEDGEGEKTAEDIVTPEAVLPFKVTLEEAQKLFSKWISGLWFAPNSLKNDSHAKQLHGVYRPFWTYDSNTISHWMGERGTYYYTTETYTTTEDGKTVTKTRQVRHTMWIPVSGVHSEFFDDVLIDAGKDAKYPTKYGLNELTPYTPEYLSGFGAERYAVSCEEGWSKAKSVIADEIREGVRSEIGGDEQRILSINTAYNGITYKHILLPLWVSCYRFNNKSFCFQINGQTGEVTGDRPYSFWKIFTLVVLILALIGGVVLLSQKKPSRHQHHSTEVEDDQGSTRLVFNVARDA